MAVTIVETRTETRAITGGVDTHADVHVAAALDPIGGLLGVEEFPATPAGYARLLGWLGGFGMVCLVGIDLEQLVVGTDHELGGVFLGPCCQVPVALPGGRAGWLVNRA